MVQGPVYCGEPERVRPSQRQKLPSPRNRRWRWHQYNYRSPISSAMRVGVQCFVFLLTDRGTTAVSYPKKYTQLRDLHFYSKIIDNSFRSCIQLQKKLVPTEIWYCRRILRILWTESVSNGEIDLRLYHVGTSFHVRLSTLYNVVPDLRLDG